MQSLQRMASLLGSWLSLDLAEPWQEERAKLCRCKACTKDGVDRCPKCHTKLVMCICGDRDEVAARARANTGKKMKRPGSGRAPQTPPK